MQAAGLAVGLARAQRWTLRAGLFLLPLAYTGDTYDQFVLPKLLLARVLAALLLTLLVARLALEGRLTVRRSPLDLPIVAWLGSTVLSTVFALNSNVAVFGTYSRYDGLLTALTYAALFWLASQTLTGPNDARTLLRVILASGYVVAGIAIAQSVRDTVGQGALAQAFGPLGQANVLGTFLAMLVPLGILELRDARSWTARILVANVLVLLGLALLLTVSRSSWIAAAAGVMVLVIGEARRTARIRLLAGVGATVALAVLALLILQASPAWRHLDLRLAGSFSGQDWHDRLAVWHDAPNLVLQRPLAGFGPDSFGLVYGQVRTLDGPQLVDKAHAEVLQIAVTQGLIGVAGYMFILVAFIAAFWKARRSPGAVAVFASWIAYQTALQPNFTALGSALPYWIFAAAAMVWWRADRTFDMSIPRAPAYTAAITSAALFLGVSVFGAYVPHAADASLRIAAEDDFDRNPALALSPAQTASSLEPRESVYVAEVGNVAFERGQWRLARQAYEDAAALGTFQPFVYRNLAYTYLDLGLREQAHQAAAAAYRLNPHDRLSQSLLAQFTGPGA